MGIIGHRLDNPTRVYSFDELLLLPGLAKLSPRNIDISTDLDGHRLSVPFISAAMDTVTEAELATVLAQHGGLGVIHRNCTTEEAVEMVRKVKKTEIPKEHFDTATKDKKNRLAVAAAVSTTDIDRAVALSHDADFLFTDVASFYNMKVIEGTKKIIKETGRKIVVGNLGTREGVLHSVREIGAENIAAIKVGMGGGSICITTDVTGVGSPSSFATEQAVIALNELGLLDKIPIIADGGIKSSRDIAFCISLGASMVMLGNMFARCEESAGEKVTRDGKQYKTYWGMGSAEARKKRMAMDRYQETIPGKSVDEGIKMYVPLEGKAGQLVEKLSAELRVTLGYIGATNVREAREVANFVVGTRKEEKVSEK